MTRRLGDTTYQNLPMRNRAHGRNSTGKQLVDISTHFKNRIRRQSARYFRACTRKKKKEILNPYTGKRHYGNASGDRTALQSDSETTCPLRLHWETTRPIFEDQYTGTGVTGTLLMIDTHVPSDRDTAPTHVIYGTRTKNKAFAGKLPGIDPPVTQEGGRRIGCSDSETMRQNLGTRAGKRA